MIYRNSNAPVLLKKIPLRVWSLREEITHVILQNIDKVDEKELVQNLIDEYSPKGPKLRLIKSEESKETSDEPQNKPDPEQVETNEKEITQKIACIPEEKTKYAKTVMSEIYMEEIYFFSDSPFVEGQSIVVKFCVPEKFIMNADVTYCQAYGGHQRVLGERKLPYRICAKFTFLRPGEKTILRKFLTSVEPTISSENSPESARSSDEGYITEEMFEESSAKEAETQDTEESTEGNE